MKSTKKGLSLNFIVFGTFLVLFLICYSAALIHDFGYMDDYYDIISGHSDGVIKKRIAEGRPLYAVIYGVITSGGMDLEDLRWFRLGGIIGLSLLAFSVFYTLVYMGWNRFQCFCLSCILCTTFPFQLYVTWATTSIFIFAAFISGLALLLTDKAVHVEERKIKYVLITGAVLILLIAITIYQSAAMFFWVLAAIIVLKQKNPLSDILHRFIWYGIVCASSLMFGFFIFNIGLDSHYIAAEKSALSFDIQGKIILLYKMLSVVLNFPFLSFYHFFFSDDIPYTYAYMHEFDKRFTYDIFVSIIVFLVIMIGLYLYFIGSIWERFLRCLFALLFLPLSIAPSMVISIDFISYRVLSSLTSLIVLYAYFAFYGYMRLWKNNSHALIGNLSLTIATCTSILLADYHIRNYLITPQIEELKIMRFPLKTQDISRAKSIHIIHPTKWGPRESLAPLIWFEFGMPSSIEYWSVSSMIFHLLDDIDSDYTNLPVISTAATPNKIIESPANSLIIDMRNLAIRSQAYRWIEGMNVPGKLVLSSFFDVYRDNQTLYFVKEFCSYKDIESSFFLHIFPSENEGNKWDNFDFHFIWHGVIYEDKCMAIVHLPDYANAHVITGQYTAEGNRIWEGKFHFSSH